MTDLSRRSMLAGLAGAAVTATSGCLGAVTGDKPLTFESSAAHVDEATSSDTGYELSEEKAPVVKRDFSVAGQTRTVEVTNHLAVYEKAIDLGPLGSHKAGLFAVYTTPQIDIAGQPFNPIKDMSNRELLAQFQSRYDDLTIKGQVGSTTVQSLGTQATVDKYDASATLQGTQIPIYIHVTRVKHDGDFVLAIGAYPQRLSGEESTILRLVKNIVH